MTTDDLAALLPCEDPEEPCDQDGRDEHRWCDYCIARSVIRRAGVRVTDCNCDAPGPHRLTCPVSKRAGKRLAALHEQADNAGIGYAAGVRVAPSPHPGHCVTCDGHLDDPYHGPEPCNLCPHAFPHHEFVPSPSPEALDVERLAVAINAAQIMGVEWWGRDLTPAAAKVAREYAALDRVGTSPEAHDD